MGIERYGIPWPYPLAGPEDVLTRHQIKIELKNDRTGDDGGHTTGLDVADALRMAGIEFEWVAVHDRYTGGQGTRDMWLDVESGDER